MMIVRPATQRDVAGLLTGVRHAQSPLPGLPADAAAIEALVSRSVATCAGTLPQAEQCLVFVLDDEDAKRLIACAVLVPAIGLSEPRYSFHVGKVVHASKELALFAQAETLLLGNDHTGASELCCVHAFDAANQVAHIETLLRGMLLFVAAFPATFAATMIVQLPGLANAGEQPAFWQGLGSRFHDVEAFPTTKFDADRMKSQVAALLPRHPVYVPFLTEDAQNAIGKVGTQAAAFCALLEREGFAFHGNVDIVDAGPIVECPINRLRTVRQGGAGTLTSAAAPAGQSGASSGLVCAGSTVHAFRAAQARLSVVNGQVSVEQGVVNALAVTPGASVRYLLAD